MDLLNGQRISLRPAEPIDREPIFNWLANSNITHKMMGPPLFPDCPVPSWDEFLDSYPDYFFNGTEPQKGRCFIIELDKEAIGQINHDEITGANNSTEFDIWLKDEKFTQKGYGSEAIELLMNYLIHEFNSSEFRIAPSKRNSAAVKTYQKLGFKESTNVPSSFIPDYNDAVFMIKTVRKN